MKKVFSFFIILISSLQIAKAQNPPDLHGQIQNPNDLHNHIQDPSQNPPQSPYQPLNPSQTQPYAPSPNQSQPPAPTQMPPAATTIRSPVQQPTPLSVQPAVEPVVFQMQPQIQTIIPSQSQVQDTQQILPGLQTQALFQNAYQMTSQPTSLAQNQANSKGIYYSIDYDPSSKIKDVPLKNITMNVEVYYYGNPEGRIAVKTDENQNFILDEFKEITENNYLTLEILSLGDQNKYNAKCHGLVTPGYTKIMIKCDSTKQA